jgi:putative membrane protein
MSYLALTAILAQTEATRPPHPLLDGLLSTVAYGALGIALLFLGFKVFDWLTPRLDLEKELAEKNVGVAIVVAALLLSLGFIIAHTISS